MGFTSTSRQVSALITKVDGRNLRAAIQTAAVHVIGHAMEHGHSPLANALDDRMALSPMLKRLQPRVQSFLTKNGPFNYSKDTGYVFSKAKRDAMREDGYAFESFASDAPAWDDVPVTERKEHALDVFKEVERLIDRATKKQVQGLCIDAAMIDYLRALCGQYAGKKAIAEAQAKAAAVSAEAKDVAQTAAIDAELAAAGV